MYQPCSNLQESDISKIMLLLGRNDVKIGSETNLDDLNFIFFKGKKPRAFYKVQDLEAQRFIGRCLESASKRLPAKELMLDPFLALGDFDDKPESRNDIQKPFQNDNIKIEDLQLNEDLPRTNMTITGKLNPEDETIFLKVQIADRDGKFCPPHVPMFSAFFSLCIL